jgi:nucleotide-binding universal stress UspA family protein
VRDGATVKIIVWLTESTWPACVDAASDQPEAQVVLMHVIDPDSVEAAEAARAGLFGRGIPAAAPRVQQTLLEAQAALLDAAEARLNRPAQRVARTGRVEREVVTACADADLLVLGRDGDHARLGPRSLGRATRFVLDHAPCRVLLVWPDEPPSLATLPSPPHGPPPGPHPPPGPPADFAPPTRT